MHIKAIKHGSRFSKSPKAEMLSPTRLQQLNKTVKRLWENLAE
jgi:hypothetical protein